MGAFFVKINGNHKIIAQRWWSIEFFLLILYSQTLMSNNK